MQPELSLEERCKEAVNWDSRDYCKKGYGQCEFMILNRAMCKPEGTFYQCGRDYTLKGFKEENGKQELRQRPDC